MADKGEKGARHRPGGRPALARLDLSGGTHAPPSPASISPPPAAGEEKKGAATAPVASTLVPWGAWDWACLAVFFVISVVTRFWRIEDPKSIIFDEAHFNKFTSWYVSQHYFVDIHPPLAKLAFALLLKSLGFVGAQEDKIRWWVDASEGGFIGTRDWMLFYDPAYGLPYIPLRRLSASVSVAFVCATFLACRAMGLGRVAACLGAWMAMLELVVLVQSRAILCDIFLYFFNMATIGASFASMRPGMSERSRVLWCLFTGFLLGCALSVKLTALGTVAVVGVHQSLAMIAQGVSGRVGDVPLTDYPRLAVRGLIRASCILIPTAIIFFGLWIVHLEVLPYSGQGDNFMIPEFQKTLTTKPPHAAHGIHPPVTACPNLANQWSDCGFAGITEQGCLDRGCCWDPESTRAWCYHIGELTKPTMALWPKIKEVLRATWANNNGGAVMEHPFMSQWWEWPIMLPAHTVPFAATNEGGQIKALGNPAVWLGVFSNFCVVTAFFLACGLWALSSGSGAGGVSSVGGGVAAIVTGEAERRVNLLIAFTVTWSGYLLNLVPYQLITRSKFVYHYIPALMVGVLLTAVTLDGVWRWASGHASRTHLARILSLLAFSLVAFGFYYWGIPYAYGVRISPEANRARLSWSSKW